MPNTPEPSQPKIQPLRLLMAYDPPTETNHINILADTRELRRLLDLAEANGSHTIDWNAEGANVKVVVELIDRTKRTLHVSQYYTLAADPTKEIGHAPLDCC